MPITKLTDAIVANIETLVRRHLHVEAVAIAIGISDRTLYRWLSIGRKERKHRAAGGAADERWDAYVKLLTAFDAGMAQVHGDLVESIQAAGRDPKLWTASAWLLERRWPLRWGRREVEKLTELEQRITDLAANISTQSGGTKHETPKSLSHER